MRRHYRTLIVLLLAASLALGAEPLRVGIPGAGGEPDAEVRAILELAGAVAVHGDAAKEAGVVLADDSSVGGVEAWREDDLVAVRDRVRGGSGLVVVGRAVEALPDSATYSALLGRDGVGPAGGGADSRAAAGPLLLEVPDQSHPLVQCLTHSLLRGGRAGPAGRESVTVLGTAPRTGEDPKGGERAWRPAVWLRREGLGLVAVIALELPPKSEAEARPSTERLLLRALEARAILHVGGREALVPLPVDLPVAAASPDMGKAGAEDPWPFPAREGFFRGRQIAGVMSHEGADWLVRPDREETEEPERVLDALRIAEGSTVADLGAGVGYFTLRVARRVGPKGKVIAVDVQKEMLRRLETRRREAGIDNVVTTLATERDPKLPEGSVDLVLMVDVYHELARPSEVMEGVRRSLLPPRDGRSAGRVALVEYRGEDPRVPIRPLHRITLAQATGELALLGFRRIAIHDFLRHQRIIVFEAAGGSAPPGR